MKIKKFVLASILIIVASCEKDAELVEIPNSVIQNIADTAAASAATAAASSAATSAANAVASSVSDAATSAVNAAFAQQAADQANQVNDDPLPPGEYDFTRNGLSTVYYTGQTARLKMAGEMHSAFSDTSKSEADILAMFNDGTGFSDASLNSSGKNIGGKTASSSYASASVKPQIQAFITRVVNDVFPNYNNDASKGVAGKLTDPGGRTVHIDAKGFEMNQIFTKSLMGALVTDQIINGYLWRGKLDAGSNIANNDNGVYNFDMNLTNIIYNPESDKLSFIDFDKVTIDSRKINSQNYSSRVVVKFRESLKKYDLFAKFDWDKFVRSVYG